MSSSESQPEPTAAIREEVRRTIQQLNEMVHTETNFDQFCQTVLAKVVKITSAHGAILWQVNGNQTPQVAHQVGGHPNKLAQTVVSQENSQHNAAVLEVVNRQQPMGVPSDTISTNESFDANTARDESFLMLFSPIYDRDQKCCGTLELLQRGNITPEAQDGYLRFLVQISQLFPRWQEQQAQTNQSVQSGRWKEKLNYVSEVHHSIDPIETAYAIANESRRLLNSDRVSIAKWNGRRCKIKAISSQDRFDNRANVVRKLGLIATSCVSTDTQLWFTGNTEGLAPEVIRQINDYLDESHSRSLIILPLTTKPPANPAQDSRRRKKEKTSQAGGYDY